ncbi:hypothetical protein ACLOJK_003961 [Asimina triloba]
MASGGWDGRQARRGRDGEIAVEAASLPLSRATSLLLHLPPSLPSSLPLEAAYTSISSSSSAAHSRRVRLSRSARPQQSPAHLHREKLSSGDEIISIICDGGGPRDSLQLTLNL